VPELQNVHGMAETDLLIQPTDADLALFKIPNGYRIQGDQGTGRAQPGLLARAVICNRCRRVAHRSSVTLLLGAPSVDLQRVRV
jgi:hypothetical protein